MGIMKILTGRESGGGLTEHEQKLLQDWHDDCLAKYSGAETAARELYNGFMGMTFMRFMQRYATEDVNISKGDMVKFLKDLGYRNNHVCGELRFHGIRHIIHGSVRSGNYGT